MMTATRVETIPPITRAEVEGLARTEYARVADQLRSLAPDDWSKPTDCPLWDVRACGRWQATAPECSRRSRATEP